MVLVPEVHHGDVYHYALDGRLTTLDFEMSLVDFEGIHAGAPRAGTYAFPPDSELTITIGETVEPRLDWTGQTKGAVQASWLIRSTDFDARVHAFDEWISPTDGELVQAHTRMMLFNGAEYEHQARTTMNQRPSLLMASVVAGETLTRAWSKNWVLPAENPLPYFGRENGTVEARVDRIDGPACEAIVHFDVRWPRFGSVDLPSAFGDYRITAVFGAGSGLPLRYTTQWTGPMEVEPLGLRLLSNTRGEGAPVAMTGAVSDAAPIHRPEPIHGGVPADHGCLFGTCLGDAMDVLKSNRTVQDWLDGHPDADLWMVNHVTAEDGSRYRDAWRAVWSDEESSLSATHFAPRNDTTNATLRVTMGAPKTGPVPDLAAAVTIDALAHVHVVAFGGRPEVLTCYFATGVCGVGTHLGTGTPRLTDALEPAIGRFPLGVVVGIETGVVHQIHLQGPELLGPTPEGGGAAV